MLPSIHRALRNLECSLDQVTQIKNLIPQIETNSVYIPIASSLCHQNSGNPHTIRTGEHGKQSNQSNSHKSQAKLTKIHNFKDITITILAYTEFQFFIFPGVGGGSMSNLGLTVVYGWHKANA